jgi:hypothetical protein
MWYLWSDAIFQKNADALARRARSLTEVRFVSLLLFKMRRGWREMEKICKPEHRTWNVEEVAHVKPRVAQWSARGSLENVSSLMIKRRDIKSNVLTSSVVRGIDLSTGQAEG